MLARSISRNIFLKHTPPAEGVPSPYDRITMRRAETVARLFLLLTRRILVASLRGYIFR